MKTRTTRQKSLKKPAALFYLPAAVTPRISSLIEASQREADPLLATHGALFGASLESSESFYRAINRIIATTPQGRTMQKHRKAVNDYLMRMQPPMSKVPDCVDVEIECAYSEAAFFLGLAIGRRIGGAR